MTADIHAIILTKDEELHIARCIESLGGACASVTVVDSGSSDRTVEIARRMGADVLTNPWINYATQMNFGIDALAGRGGWLLRIDADEIVDRESAQSLSNAVTGAAADVEGLLVARRIYFLGKRIRHGAIEPSWQLRLFRNGAGRCEQRWMDEHILVGGRVEKSGVVLSDVNLNSLTWWTAKHNSYASREAVALLDARHRFLPTAGGGRGMSSQARIRRFMKERVYMGAPAGARSLLYVIYRYVFRLGFLDGAAGFYFHVLQGFWYRTLVDAKMAEIEAFARDRDVSILEAIRDRTGIVIEHDASKSAASGSAR